MYGLIDMQSEDALDILEEELLADAYAGIDIYRFKTSKFTAAVNDKMDQLYLGKQLRQENGTRQTNGPNGERFSLSENMEGEKGSHGPGVILDTNIFDGVKPRYWGKVLRDYVYQNLAGSELTMYDQNGNPETVHLAKTNDRVQKDGAKNSHKVIDKLARYKGDNVRALVTVHIPEALAASEYENSTGENNRQWMDQNGWEHRKVYLQDISGTIYEATLNIARGPERNILYDINNIRAIDKKRASDGAVPSTENGRGSHITRSSKNNITELPGDVKQNVPDTLSEEIERQWRERFSAEGYWYPKLNQQEWRLLEKEMARQIGSSKNRLDQATKWLYAKEKGVEVFAIYGIGNGTEATPLYASGKSRANADYQHMRLYLKGEQNGSDGQRADRSAAAFNRRVNTVLARQQRGQSFDLDDVTERGAADRNVAVHAGQQGGNTAADHGGSQKDSRKIKSPPNETNAHGFTGKDTAPETVSEAIERQWRERFSLDEESVALDSQGNTLTAEQTEYFRDSQVRDAQGRLLVLYHQTGSSFTVFDTHREGAGARDDGTPFGIFMKSSPKDIGLQGKVQMPLYANIINPLYAQDREALRSRLEQFSPEYWGLMQEIGQLDSQYRKRSGDAQVDLQRYISEWKRNHPGESSAGLYQDPEYIRLDEAEDAITDEWTDAVDELSRRAKEIVTDALVSAGYDGVILREDSGSFGRRTDAYIALNPEQVKNVSNTTPTSNPDIRYSADEDVADDESYLAAVEAGDMETAQEMVDRAARAASDSPPNCHISLFESHPTY